MHILYLTAEQWPTFRADLSTLFGKYLPRFGVTCDLVTEQDINNNSKEWPAGKAILCKAPKNRAAHYVMKFLHQSKVLISADYKQYQAVQVRDMTMIALVALVMCKLKRKPFYYWLSYPQSEGQVQRAKARGMKAGVKYWFPLLQGLIGKQLLYKIILTNADHVFVQSQHMLEVVARYGIKPEKMTTVPMGVDLEAVQKEIVASNHPFLDGKRVLVYLGTLDRVRRIEILFDMLTIIRKQVHNIALVLVGDTEDAEHRAWLKQQAEITGIAQHILWTGWLPMSEAWRYVAAAEIGLSPIPRGYLLDMGSPTKAVEYMALGLPVVMNDNPDQVLVAQESGAAKCIPLEAAQFANAVLTVLNDTSLKITMQNKGMDYVNKARGYHQIANSVSAKYHQLISKLS